MMYLIEIMAKAIFEQTYFPMPAMWDNQPPQRKQQDIDKARATLSALEVAGYKVLKREPTEEMTSVFEPDITAGENAAADWKRMWDAAETHQ